MTTTRFPRVAATAVAVAAALCSVHAGATLATFSASQGAKGDFAPCAGDLSSCAHITPAVQPALTTARSNFGQGVTTINVYDFESSGGTPTLVTGSGGGVIDGNAPSYDFSAGRYNMTGWKPGATGGLTDFPNGDHDNGHWYESFQTFTLDFGQNISAISFFLTDFTDFDGTLSLTLLADPSDQNGINSDEQVFSSTNINGGLTFFGLTSTTAFRTVRFNIGQPAECDPNRPDGQDRLIGCDFLGFDEITVGTFQPDGNPTPEPGTMLLAVAGLALASRAKRLVSSLALRLC